ncbi:hypothetical protein UlMin_033827 [Ulmus minor]
MDQKSTTIINCSQCNATSFRPSGDSTSHRCLKCATSVSASTKEDPVARRFSVKGLASRLYKNREKKNSMPNNYSSMNVKPRTSTARSNKRALLCGVTYNNKRKYRLKGTINDVQNMRDLLITKFGYPDHSIRVLTEFEDKEFHPTKKNIETSLKWLVQDCQRGDKLVFYFSGHGLRQPDFQDDELDGFDETICPVDFMQEGMVLDNEINTYIVRPLKEGVILHAIVDACHSGTILDLKYVYDYKNNKWIDNSPPSGVNKGTSGGLAICLSACEDSQLAADTTPHSGNNMNGALTYIFVESLKKNPDLTYADLLLELDESIKEAAVHDKCFHSRKLARIFRRRVLQEPLLSSSQKIDVNTYRVLQ